MTHPFLWFTETERLWLTWASLVHTAVAMAVLGWLDPGRRTGGKQSIVSFELAGTAAKAKLILDGWGERGRIIAGFNLGFDFVLILGYSTFLSLLCLRASHHLANARAAALGGFIAWLPLIAGLLDCVEDTALLAILFGQVSDRLARVARTSALGKFTFLSCAVLFVIFAWL